MATTVKELAKISGVSVRTLHFYDEIDLLKPAYVGDNGYRYYKEEQLFILQQILFFRELGMELKDIRSILNQSDFDKLTALKSHRRVILQKNEKMRELIQTIDRTIKRLKGETKMKDKDLFTGFTPEKQDEYEKYLMNRIGAEHPSFAESKKNVKGWTKADWEKVGREWISICKNLSHLMQNKLSTDSSEVQAVVKHHHSWIKKFWTPNRETYSALGMGYTGFEWKQAFAPYDREHPKLAMFLAKAMEHFAESELE